MEDNTNPPMNEIDRLTHLVDIERIRVERKQQRWSVALLHGKRAARLAEQAASEVEGSTAVILESVLTDLAQAFEAAPDEVGALTRTLERRNFASRIEQIATFVLPVIIAESPDVGDRDAAASACCVAQALVEEVDRITLEEIPADE